MKSMTGFGSTEKVIGGEKLSIDIKTLNFRYLDVKVRGPRDYSAFEIQIQEELKKSFHRGHIEVSINRDQKGAHQVHRYEFNQSLAAHYEKALRQAKSKLKLRGDITIDQLLQLPDIWTQSKEKVSPAKRWQAIQAALRISIQKVEAMRSKEGLALQRVIEKNISDFNREISFLSRQRKQLSQNYEKKLHGRIQSFLGEEKVDSQRLHQEVAYVLDRADVSEELDRLASHLKQFRTAIQGKGAIGKSLDFLIQEMNREVNTIASKIQDVKLTTNAIRCKSILEKIREQIQNVE